MQIRPMRVGSWIARDVCISHGDVGTSGSRTERLRDPLSLSESGSLSTPPTRHALAHGSRSATAAKTDHLDRLVHH